MNFAMSKIHLEIFDTNRLKIFKKLSAFIADGYLAGGTALALQIGHRKSFDFDIFIEKPVSYKLKKRVEKLFRIHDYYVNTAEQISFHVDDAIGITFLTYPYKTLVAPLKTDSIRLAHVHDIVADKAHTIGRRAVWRDYVDFFFFLKWNMVTIEKIIDLAEKKFRSEFVKTQFLEQLVYFNDLQIQKTEYIKESFTPEEIQSFLSQKVEEYLKRVLRP